MFALPLSGCAGGSLMDHVLLKVNLPGLTTILVLYVRPVRYVLQPVFGQYVHCWTPDGSSRAPSVHVCPGCRPGDGTDAVATANRRLEVSDAAVTSRRRSVDRRLLAGDVTLLLIQLLVCRSLWSL